MRQRTLLRRPARGEAPLAQIAKDYGRSVKTLTSRDSRMDPKNTPMATSRMPPS